MSSQNKIGSVTKDKSAFSFNKPNYQNRPNSSKNSKSPTRPYFTLRPGKKYQPQLPPSSSAGQKNPPMRNQKYKYGLRRGLPASNVNGYNSYPESGTKLYQPPKRWHTYTPGYRFSTFKPTTPTTTTEKRTTSTTTTTTTTESPMRNKDVAEFGPQDAVTDVMRNELLYEFVRDRQGSIPIDNRRSLFK